MTAEPEPGRDPWGRVITVAYFALIASDRRTFAAFDHREILEYAVDRLRNKLEYTTVGFQFLPARSTAGGQPRSVKRPPPVRRRTTRRHRPQLG